MEPSPSEFLVKIDYYCREIDLVVEAFTWIECTPGCRSTVLRSDNSAGGTVRVDLKQGTDPIGLDAARKIQGNNACDSITDHSYLSRVFGRRVVVSYRFNTLKTKPIPYRSRSGPGSPRGQAAWGGGSDGIAATQLESAIRSLPLPVL